MTTASRVSGIPSANLLASKSVIITGAGTGIGRASALQLAEAGAKVMAVGRRAAPLQSLCSEHGGISYMAQALDSPEGCARAVAQTAERLGPPLILVHAAGLGGHVDRPIWEQTTQAWRATMAINLDAAFELVRLTVPAMRAKRSCPGPKRRLIRTAIRTSCRFVVSRRLSVGSDEWEWIAARRKKARLPWRNSSSLDLGRIPS